MREHVVKVGLSSVVGYKVNNNKELSEFQKLTLLHNCTRAHMVGQITERHVKEIKTMLNTWLSGIYLERDISGMTVKEFPYYPTFATITLPKEQMHDDQWIKKHLFFRLLEWLVKEKGVRHWFWRAEKKRGKRIHFHLILDKYVYYKDLRIKWNEICRDNYYHDDMKFDYDNMGSPSIDIEKITENKGAAKYVTKYVSKDEFNDRIGGHVWGCSRSLKNITPPVFVCDDVIMNDMDKLRNVKGIQQTATDNYEVLVLPKGKYLDSYNLVFWNLYCMHSMEMYKLLYLTEKSYENSKEDIKDVERLIYESNIVQAELWV